ncbi:MAG: B12-binding domain-containing radical SAM protein, partial [Deltaproteobacteria bacterium]|nr:B12-binding domain-containing radical SAM protein [Deltaproteobacteria bacterium]
MTLKVLLVRPPGRYVSLSFPDGPMVAPPRSLLHLAAAVKHRPDVACRVIDALAHPDLERLARVAPPFLFGLAPDEVVARARPFAPDVIAVTNMAAYFYRETQELVAALGAAFPDAFVVVGGPDPSCEWERYLKEGAHIDAVAIGEGEETFAELVEALAKGADWRAVAGLAWLEDGVPRRAPARAYTSAMDALVPDFSLIRLEDYFALAERGFRSRITYRYPGVERTADVVTSRGCPYKCSFCSIHIHMGRRFRAQSPESVLAQIGDLVGRGVRHIHFEDDIVNFDRNRWKAILRGLVERRWPLT